MGRGVQTLGKARLFFLLPEAAQVQSCARSPGNFVTGIKQRPGEVKLCAGPVYLKKNCSRGARFDVFFFAERDLS